MQDVTLIGIDLGKHSFHVHGQDRQGKARYARSSTASSCSNSSLPSMHARS